MARARKSDATEEPDDGSASAAAPIDPHADPVALPEPEPETAPKTEDVRVETVVVPADEPIPAQRPSIIGPMLLGGALAAGLGFAVGLYLARANPGLIGVTDTTADQQVADLNQRLAALTSKVEGLPAAGGVPPDLQAAVEAGSAASSAAKDQVTALAATVGDLATRVGKLEAAPPGGGPSAAEIAALTEAAQEKARAAEAAAAQAKNEAEAATRTAAARAALGEITVAVDSGAPFAPAIATLDAAGIAVPDGLRTQAQGVPTLDALKTAFPPVARDALAASLVEASAGGGTWERLTAFLRSQTRARSLEPRAGTDPDAVLSRAEAALRTGDLAAALNELAALPAAGQSRMAEWSGLAHRRLDATQAIDALGAALK